MLYWIVNAIGSAQGKIEANQFHKLSMYGANTIEKLLAKGVIRQIQSPPVTVIPDFKPYATALKKMGIVAVMDILESDVQTLSKTLDIDTQTAQAIMDKAYHVLSPNETLESG